MHTVIRSMKASSMMGEGHVQALLEQQQRHECAFREKLQEEIEALSFEVLSLPKSPAVSTCEEKVQPVFKSSMSPRDVRLQSPGKLAFQRESTPDWALEYVPTADVPFQSVFEDKA